ncbi:MAG: 3-ketosteroid 9alpha-monooxygenase subunit [Actinomycetota bacterium]
MVNETADARSFVLGVPAELHDLFAYEAGQFCTFRVVVDGETLLRSYSMSSSPALNEPLTVTVKRVPGGAVSNWMLDNLRAGSVVDATRPAGVFCLSSALGRGEIVAFCGGSGVTPIVSIAKSALATTDRSVRVLYANRDRDSVILASEFARLRDRFGARVSLTTRFDTEAGFVDAAAVGAVAEGASDPDYFVCGPGPFMDIVESALLDCGVASARVHIERFTPSTPVAPPSFSEPDDSEPADAHVTITLGGKTKSTTHRRGTTILQTARQMGLAPPFSCESGSCATCMARLVEGAVSMFVNNALTDDEVREGWILTCQSVPTSPTVNVVYEQ